MDHFVADMKESGLNLPAFVKEINKTELIYNKLKRVV
jgi:hypothetical protein